MCQPGDAVAVAVVSMQQVGFFFLAGALQGEQAVPFFKGLGLKSFVGDVVF